MPIKRTNRINQKKFLKENPNLKILDLGCTHVNYWEEANHFADIVNYSDFFNYLFPIIINDNSIVDRLC